MKLFLVVVCSERMFVEIEDNEVWKKKVLFIYTSQLVSRLKIIGNEIPKSSA